MDELPVAELPALGSFRDVSVRFPGTHRAGVEAEIELRFTAGATLDPGDVRSAPKDPRDPASPAPSALPARSPPDSARRQTVSLVLPDFESEAAPFALAASTPAGAFERSSWTAASATAVFTAAARVPQGTSVTLSVPPVIRLPPSGVRVGESTRWSLHTDASAGPAPPLHLSPVHALENERGG